MCECECVRVSVSVPASVCECECVRVLAYQCISEPCPTTERIGLPCRGSVHVRVRVSARVKGVEVG